MSSGIIEAGLSAGALDIHRGLASLQEELEAIDFYHQRAEATADRSLRAVLLHNRNDEMEHAAMLLEALRRALPELDGQLRKWLFRSGDFLIAEEGRNALSQGHGLGLGKLACAEVEHV